MPDKTTPQMPPQAPAPTIKHHFMTALIAVGIILVIGLFIWIPFKLIPALFSSGSNYVATTLSSTFVPATSTQAASQNNSAETNSNTAVSSSNTSYAPAVSSYYGLPDLAISLVATGIIDPSGQFIQTPYAGANDTVAVKFEVRNIGTNVSGSWNMNLTMPSQTTPNYTSPYQESIRPGDAIEFTASFTNPVAQGINEAYITVDPSDLVAESNKTNNSLTIPINIEGTAYSTYYNTNPVYPMNNNYYAPGTPSYGTVYTWTNINANCYANPQTIYPGGTINWIVSASGGNGLFTYSWSGSNGLYSTSNEASATYYTPGSVVANISVTSNGQTITKQCSAYVY